MKEMTIGHLAKATGVKVVTIRYYEQAGILPVPLRTQGIIEPIRPSTYDVCSSSDDYGTWASLWSRFGIYCD
jgi:hypothetical protein